MTKFLIILALSGCKDEPLWAGMDRTHAACSAEHGDQFTCVQGTQVFLCIREYGEARDTIRCAPVSVLPPVEMP